MIEFYIENEGLYNEVILPDDFSFTWIENNPEINNEGDFTLDMTVSLEVAQNKIAFGMIDRLANTSITISANAKIVEDGVTRYGTMTISKPTDLNVSFQFLSGNSELNYLAKSEDKIYTLNWGEELEITVERALDSINNWHWTNKFVCCPVKAGTSILNEYNLDLTAVTDGLIVMQPYLLYYITKLPELLGYTMGDNVLLADERAQRMYLVNPVDSLKYADCLPDMTIREFIKAIEDFFNVSFIVLGQTKTLSIVRTKTEMATKKRVKITPINGFERDLSDDSSAFKFGYTKISYNLPGSNYFSYHRLADDIVAKCTIEEFFNIRPEGYTTDKLNILRNTADKRDWINTSAKHEFPGYQLMFPGTGVVYYSYNVNRLADYGTSSKNVLSLNLTPSAIYKGTQKAIDYADNNSTFNVHYTMPESSNSYLLVENKTIFEMIEGDKGDIVRSSNLEVCMYSGRFKIEKSFTGSHSGTLIRNYVNYPCSNIDLPQWEDGGVYYEIIDPLPAFKTMRLVGDDGVVADYRPEVLIDPSLKYIFYFEDRPDRNVNCIFYVESAYYMPISIEHIKTKKSRSSLLKGTFYRMLE